MIYAHMTDFWLDKIALEFHHTKKICHLLQNKFALDQ